MTNKIGNLNMRFMVLILLGLCISAFCAAKSPQKKNGIKKVVIDAGHGGHDPGTMGKHSKEKDIALGIALKLGKQIKESFADVEVYYTRNTDVFVELYRRAQIANEKKADLFISIHCNGTKASDARGVETWVMGLHKSKENLEVAKKENASILMEDNYSQYDGFDPNSPEANIIFSLYQNVYLDQSLDMATRVQDHFQHKLGLINRGVKQAGFWVLYKTTMPGILVEAGFLSNPSDEEYLLSEKGQDNIANAVFNAFTDYKGEKPLLQNAVASKQNQIIPVTTRLDSSPQHKAVTAVEIKAVEKDQKGNQEVKNKPDKKPGTALYEEVIYRVQIVSSPKKLKEDNQQFKGTRDLFIYNQKGIYKYTTGECKTLKDALKLQSVMQQKGFKDAFVVAFYKGERISVEEARKLTNFD